MGDDRTPWQIQRDQALADFSRPIAERARVEFRAVKAAQLAAVAGEACGKRHAIDAMRRKYETLSAAYLKVTGTTYAAWEEHGPKGEWDEVLEAARVDAVWDRLVERGLVQWSRGGG